LPKIHNILWYFMLITLLKLLRINVNDCFDRLHLIWNCSYDVTVKIKLELQYDCKLKPNISVTIEIWKCDFYNYGICMFLSKVKD